MYRLVPHTNTFRLGRHQQSSGEHLLLPQLPSLFDYAVHASIFQLPSCQKRGMQPPPCTLLALYSIREPSHMPSLSAWSVDRQHRPGLGLRRRFLSKITGTNLYDTSICDRREPIPDAPLCLVTYDAHCLRAH